jgi:hypothetical protein
VGLTPLFRPRRSSLRRAQRDWLIPIVASFFPEHKSGCHDLNRRGADAFHVRVRSSWLLAAVGSWSPLPSMTWHPSDPRTCATRRTWSRPTPSSARSSLGFRDPGATAACPAPSSPPLPRSWDLALLHDKPWLSMCRRANLSDPIDPAGRATESDGEKKIARPQARAMVLAGGTGLAYAAAMSAGSHLVR